MEEIWAILGIEPSHDPSAIKRAYARQTLKYHPEEDPEMFLRLRSAYQAAMDYSERYRQQEQVSGFASGDMYEKLAYSAEPEHQSEENGWQIAAEDQEWAVNPYLEHEAHRQFLALYTGNQRKNPKLWMEYFTSPAFLEVCREPAFTKLMLEDVEQQDNPPSREFLTWLHIAYLLTSEEVMDPGISGEHGQQFSLAQGADFDGMESILEIAARGPVPKRFAGNELAMYISFSEYRHLMHYAENDIWSEEAIADVRHIISRYVLAYLKEKCVHKEWNDVERHPAGLRLLNDFFGRQTLPEDLYRILWERLSLRTATMGRTKIFYGRLREIVLERIPGIAEETEESFSSIYFSGFQEEDETEAFFARDDVQRALRNRRFVEDYLLSCWLKEKSTVPFLQKVRAFYTENTDAPCAERIVRQADRLLMQKRAKMQMDEDRTAAVSEECMLFTSRPFFRHWLNTGFYEAENPENGQELWAYLNSQLPYLPDWSRRFGQTGKRVTITLDGHDIEIIFHAQYIEYKMDGMPMYRPFLNWTALSELLHRDNHSLFLLLPVTAAEFDRYEAVRDELARRLEDTAAPETERFLIAGFLAGHVCCLPVSVKTQSIKTLLITQPDVLTAIPMEMYAENEEHLYGCSWFSERGTLIFYEQTVSGRQTLPKNYYEGIYEEDRAVTMAKRLLGDIASPIGFNLSRLHRLPSMVCVQPRYAPQTILEGEEINEEQLELLIEQYAQGSLERLQFRWHEDSLVFLAGENGFACLYFDDLQNTYHALHALPEMYMEVDGNKIQYIPIGLGRLPEYSIHHDAVTIVNKLDNIFYQVERWQSLEVMGMEYHSVWSIGYSGNNSRHRYRIAKQKLGGFPAEEVQNHILAKFVISRYPQQIEKKDLNGISNVIENDSTNLGMVTLSLVEFMQNKLCRLRLTWDSLHIVLLQEDGRYMMAYLRDDIQRAVYYVADVSAYLDAEGKEYPKDTFMGQIMPAYLIHANANKIRNCLDLIFDDLRDLPAITGAFAGFSPESPVKPRAYEEIWEELIAIQS